MTFSEAILAIVLFWVIAYLITALIAAFRSRD